MQSIGKYKIERRLGAGAHGIVYKAVDPVLDRTVAIKHLKRQHTTATALDVIITEARSLARLSHPHIVTLFECFDLKEEVYLVMEYVAGEPLSDRLARGSISQEKAVPLMGQITDALVAAKKRGILHRDIKPANIMINGEGLPKLIDFGLAVLKPHDETLVTLSESDATENSLIGTIPYLAPERLMGSPADESSDIYALGAVFYEILSGHAAFRAERLGERIHSILNHNPPRLVATSKDAPAWLDDLVFSMLHKDKSLRPLTLQSVSRTLNAKGHQTSKKRFHLPLPSRWRAFKFPKRAWASGIGIPVAGAIALVTWAELGAAPTELEPIHTRMSRGLDLVASFAENGAIDEAQDTFESILSENPEHAGARAGLALSLVRKYTFQESDPATFNRAVETARTAYDNDPQLALSHIAMAWSAEFKGDLNSALGFYDSADLLDPDNKFSLEGRARTYQKLDKIDEAIAIFERAIELYPDELVFSTAYGDLLIHAGQYADAETILNVALSLSGDNPVTYAQLAQSQHMQNRTREAVQTIQRGLSVASDATLYNNLGTYLFFLGQYDQSAIAFERTLELEGNSHNYLYWANLGDAYRFVSGKQEEARSAHSRAIALLSSQLEDRPNHPGLNSRLALYHAKVGDKALALSSMAQVISQDQVPAVQFYRASITYEILGDRDTALEMLEHAISSGYPASEVLGDPELEKIRQDRRFAFLSMEKHKDD